MCRKERSQPDDQVQLEIKKWLIKLGILFLVTLFVFQKVIIVGTIPTSSMENTIHANVQVIGYRLAYKTAEPKRGDIVIFHMPDNQNVIFIKRIIGIPGDQITITNNELYINGILQDEKYIKEKMTGMEQESSFTIPKDSYFVMGDNRNDSYDSRFWDNPYVTSDKIIGKVKIKLTPYPKFIN